MSALIFGHDVALAKWAAEHIPHVGPVGFGPCVAIGVASSNDPAGRLLAVCVYHDYQPDHGTVQLSFIASSPLWATRKNIIGLLAVPFDQYRCYKVWTATPHKNKRALKFNDGIGFRPEGTLAHQFGKGQHAVISRMLEPDYRRMLLKYRTTQQAPEFLLENQHG